MTFFVSILQGFGAAAQTAVHHHLHRALANHVGLGFPRLRSGTELLLSFNVHPDCVRGLT